jgi:hypothetical protein
MLKRVEGIISEMLAPGRTDTFGDPCAALKPWTGPLDSLKGISDRKIILLSTATITDENIHANGLFQNVVVFYRMFDAMGYAPIMLVNDKPKHLKNIPEGLRKCRMIVTEDMLKQPMANVAAMLEIGMSLDPIVRQFVKMIGGRLFKVYLGNILNIDVETPIFINQHYFAHHVVGKNDAILVSPHYGQHAEYASYLNHVPVKGALEDLIAPYVWDPDILMGDGANLLSWKAPTCPEEEVFVIMEPNISFQKCSLVPLMIMERWYRSKGAGWKGKIMVVNGERLLMVPHFLVNVMPYLDIFKDAKVEMLGRRDIVSTLKEWPTATFVLHNYNNEFNYMTLELLYTGFPVIHNAPSWVEFGYGYDGADLKKGAELVDAARTRHSERAATYKSHAATLAWKYSPYNPAIHAAWGKIIENRVGK